MRSLHLRTFNVGLLLAALLPACISPSASTSDETNETVGVAEQQLTLSPIAFPQLGSSWHQEVAVGHSAIVASNSGTFAFYDKNGNVLPGTLNGSTLGQVPGTTVFAPFFNPSNSLYINAHLPSNVYTAPAPGIQPWQVCDPTQPPPADGTPYFQSACVTNAVYDNHTAYDPVHQRFILATHVRNMNWVQGTPGLAGIPTASNFDQYCWRFLLLAVSVSEDPTQGFVYYMVPEYYADWPRITVSGKYLVVTYKNEADDVDASKPLVTLYDMNDLAAASTGPHIFTYTQAQLSSSLPYTQADMAKQGVGFLPVPAHDEPPDSNGSLAGTAYLMSRSSSEGEVPTLFGFVPSPTDSSVKPTVITALMPSNYAGKDTLSATIRGGYLYSVYEDSSQNFAHLDQMTISTSHSGSSTPVLNLNHTWSQNIGPTTQGPFLEQVNAPVVEATANGSAVVGYSMVNGAAGTLEVHSMTFLPNGAARPDHLWASGSFNGLNSSGQPSNEIVEQVVNRCSVDPADPQAVWILGVEGAGGTAYTPVTAEVDVRPLSLRDPDFDGDGLTDVGTFRPSNGLWSLRTTTEPYQYISYGVTGDIPVPGDYDGDGVTDIAVFRPSNGTWYLRTTSAPWSSVSYGVNGDMPVPGDYDGDGMTDIAVFRPSAGTWFLRTTSLPWSSVSYGASTDIPVPGDYDGDGLTDIATFTPSTGTWSLRTTTALPHQVTYGANGDIPVPADYDGDGLTDVAVFTPSTALWSLRTSSTPWQQFTFGMSGDIPLERAVHTAQ